MGATQSAAIALVSDQEPEAWKLSSSLQLGCCLFAVCTHVNLLFTSHYLLLLLEFYQPSLISC